MVQRGGIFRILPGRQLRTSCGVQDIGMIFQDAGALRSVPIRTIGAQIRESMAGPYPYYESRGEKSRHMELFGKTEPGRTAEESGDSYPFELIGRHEAESGYCPCHADGAAGSAGRRTDKRFGCGRTEAGGRRRCSICGKLFGDRNRIMVTHDIGVGICHGRYGSCAAEWKYDGVW